MLGDCDEQCNILQIVTRTCWCASVPWVTCNVQRAVECQLDRFALQLCETQLLGYSIICSSQRIAIWASLKPQSCCAAAYLSALDDDSHPRQAHMFPNQDCTGFNWTGWDRNGNGSSTLGSAGSQTFTRGSPPPPPASPPPPPPPRSCQFALPSLDGQRPGSHLRTRCYTKPPPPSAPESRLRDSVEGEGGGRARGAAL